MTATNRRSRRAIVASIILCAALGALARPAAAEPAADSKHEAPDTEVIIPPPPDGWDSKTPLRADDLARKKERSYLTGLPLANFDPNTGYGGGVRGYYYYNGTRKNPLFAYTPYLHRVFLQFFATTKGLQFHWLDYDAPAIAGTPFRLRSQLIYMRNTSQHFFGVDDAAMAPLTFTGAGRTFDSFSEYDRALQQVRSDGTTLARYDHFDFTRPLWLVSVERTYLNGLIRPLVGLGFTYNHIDDYTGERVDAQGPDGGEKAVMGPTRLSEACNDGEIVGCDGGWDNIVRLGLSLDTRDFEPDPNNGVFIDTALDLGTKAVGSDYTYARFLVSARGYWSPMPRITDLVLAARGTFQVQSHGVPFFSLDTVPYTEDVRAGLGGLRTLRGYQQDRFIGHVLTLLNAEARWTFYRFRTLKQKFALIAVAFGDVGRVYDNVGELTLKDWRRGQGAALRIAWNQATIITTEYGFSSEDSGLYINFNHIF